MNTYILTAGILCILLGVIHSILGEYLIFRHKRKDKEIIPSKGGNDLREKHLRIIWATWHLASILGICIGLVLIMLTKNSSLLDAQVLHDVIRLIAYSMLIASLLVMFSTKGKHPGWIVLLIIGILLILAQ